MGFCCCCREKENVLYKQVDGTWLCFFCEHGLTRDEDENDKNFTGIRVRELRGEKIIKHPVKREKKDV